ncbi:MAG: hypothetical protein RL885_03720 [Planctomycetota bacterium]
MHSMTVDSEHQSRSALKPLLIQVAASAVVGAIVFVVVQVFALGVDSTIISLLGDRITERGGYPAALSPVIGWGIHLGVSLSYAALFGLLFVVLKRAPIAGAALTALLGWVTTLITAPAISVTIALAAREGFPGSLPGLNWTTGLTLWNHVGFFVVCWGVMELLRRRAVSRN